MAQSSKRYGFAMNRWQWSKCQAVRSPDDQQFLGLLCVTRALNRFTERTAHTSSDPLRRVVLFLRLLLVTADVDQRSAMLPRWTAFSTARTALAPTFRSFASNTSSGRRPPCVARNAARSGRRHIATIRNMQLPRGITLRFV